MAESSQISISGLCPSACSESWDPLALTGLLLSWLRQHFSDGNIRSSALQDRLWTSSPATSRIMIEPATLWKPDSTEQRPAILLRRGPVQSLHLGIGDRMMGGAGPEASRKLYSVLEVGSHSVFCVSRKDGECEHLGREVYNELLQFSRTVAEQMGLARIRVGQLGGLSVVEEATQNFVVPVAVAWAAWNSWEITEPDGAKFNRIKTTFTLQ